MRPSELEDLLKLQKSWSGECRISEAEAILAIASAQGVDPVELGRKLRAAGLRIPNSKEGVEKYSESKKLLSVLEPRAEELRKKIVESADAAAFAMTNLKTLKFDAPSVETALSWIKGANLIRFAETFDPSKSGGAVIIGPTGIGKSVACFCVARRMLREKFLAELEERINGKGPDVQYRADWASFDALDLGLEQQRTGLGQSEPHMITTAKKTFRVIIDDLGWERSFHVETMLDVAAYRYKFGLASLVTSGKRRNELRDTYGDALIRRFTDVNGLSGVVVDCWEKK